MKKQYPVSKKARSAVSYNKHMEKKEQRKVNKSTRKILKKQMNELVDFEIQSAKANLKIGVEKEFWE